MELHWLGGPTCLLKLGSFRLLTDPMLGASFVMTGHPSTGADRAVIERTGPMPPAQLPPLDLVLVSHLHTDHFDAEAVARLDKGLPMVAPTPNRTRLEEWGFRGVTALDWWQTAFLRKDGETLQITAVPARHGVRDETNADLGVVNGYAITHTANQSRKTVYWTGDTVWFDGLAEIRERIGPVDLLVPHLGAVGIDGPWGRMTLDAAEAARLIALFDPGAVVPIHHHTFSHYVEPVSALAALLTRADDPFRLSILTEGETWFPPR